MKYRIKYIVEKFKDKGILIDEDTLEHAITSMVEAIDEEKILDIWEFSLLPAFKKKYWKNYNSSSSNKKDGDK